MKQRKGCYIASLRHSSFSNLSVALPTSHFILQPFRCFTYLSVTSPLSQLVLQPFRRFTYVTVHYLTLPLLHLRHSSFSNPSFASPTSQALHLRHLASRPLNMGHFLNESTRPTSFVVNFSLKYTVQLTDIARRS